ncbi:TRAP transporter small permease (plasmid) [Agrobacterium tumefaciens]|nr:TRAP transporter small permease [Agrobacterium tumefaciens]
MGHLKKIYLRLLDWVVITSILAILFLIFANVFLRYAFNSGIFLAEGIARLLFVWMTFIGALLVLYDRGHIGVDMAVRRLPLQLRRVCFVLTHGIMIYATWLLLKGSWAQALINLHVVSTETGLPIALLYLAGVVFAAASGLFLISQLILMLSGKLTDEDLVVSVGEDEAEADRVASELRRDQLADARGVFK